MLPRPRTPLEQIDARLTEVVRRCARARQQLAEAALVLAAAEAEWDALLDARREVTG